MNTLLIVASLIATGKVNGQVTTIPGATNVQITSFPVDHQNITPRARLVAITPRVIPGSDFVQQQQVTSIDRSEPSGRYDNDLNLRLLPPRENHPERRPYIQTPDGKNQPEKSKIETNRTTQDVSNPVSNNVNSNRDKPRLNGPFGTNTTAFNMTNNKPEAPLKSDGVQNEQSSNTPNDSVTSEKPPQTSIVDKATGVEVTLDERASFNGDKCPTGTVKINGMCVEKD